MPAADQWFDLGRSELGWSCQAVMSTASIIWASKAWAYPTEGMDQDMPVWMVYLLDGNRLLAIDLRTRTTRQLYESPGLTGVAALYELPEQATRKPAADAQAAANP